jgi:hypothetical protein
MQEKRHLPNDIAVQPANSQLESEYPRAVRSSERAPLTSVTAALRCGTTSLQFAVPNSPMLLCKAFTESTKAFMAF